jgi:23S rRNA (uridine2552-2'-O)-methyltransferase
MTRGKRSNNWHQRQNRDYYVRRAREHGRRSRAVYKLEQIDARDHLLRPGMTVVDLGAAPGGWSEYASQRVGPQGRVVAVDMLPMTPLPNVEFIQGDFREVSTLHQVLDRLVPGRADLVLSDMAPNITGMSAVDQPQALGLAELGLQLAQEVLICGGNFVVKLFQGEGFDSYVSAVRILFRTTAIRKPAASRPHSREVYLVAKNYLI